MSGFITLRTVQLTWDDNTAITNCYSVQEVPVPQGS